MLLPRIRSRRSHAVALALPLLCAAAATAGPLQPARHAFERLGPLGAPASVAVHVPSSNRLVVFGRDGGVSLVTGDGLLAERLGALPVDATCAGPAVFAATSDPAAPDESLFVTYRSADRGTLSVGRFRLAADRRSFTFTPLFATGAPAACERVGGGVAVTADGTLLIGVGDHGNPSAAPSVASRLGKILRVTTDGVPPAPPLETNPLGPTSPVYATGVRDPVAIVTDPTTGRSWFLDRGAADGADELNLIGPLTNHGWSSAELSGYFDVDGDPHHAWAPPIGVTGLLAAGGELLGGSLDGRLVVSSDGGLLTAVTPDPADPRGSSEEVIYEPDPGGPATFVDPRALPDGSLQALGDAEGVWRLRLRRGVLREPSRRESVMPITLRKDGPGSYVLSAERLGGDASYGVHVGDVALLGPGYAHADAADLVLTRSAEDGRASARWTLGDDELGGAGSSSYVLVGAFDSCVATGLGVDSVARRRPGGGASAATGVAALGNGAHDLSGVVVTDVAFPADGLSVPRDLEFHPDVPGELWVVNRQDDSALVIHGAGGPEQTTEYFWEASGNHFLAQPSALAFGPGTGYFATAHEEDDFTQGPPPGGTPVDFMGPTLWTSDAAEFDGGHASHYDMLHDSPNGAGIAWESGTAYWVFDGWHDSLTRYDFRADHGPGGADHSDGVISRFVEGGVRYVPDVPSHLVWDHAAEVLLVADTGNNRIAELDPSGATVSGPIGPNYDGCTVNAMAGGALVTLIDGDEHGLVAPSGLEMDGCRLFVTDNATSTIYAFTRDGNLLDWLETGWPPGTLMGMAIDPRTGDLYVVDAVGDRVLRIQPR